MKCPVCSRDLDIHVTRTLLRCSCGANLTSNGRFLAGVVVSAWMVATVVMFLIMNVVANDLWPWFIWFIGGDLIFALVVYVIAFQFWRVQVAQ